KSLSASQQCLNDFPDKALSALERLLSSLVTGLFALNLCDEADQFLNTTSQRLLQGHPLSSDSTHHTYDQSRLQCLLSLSAGWYAFGWDKLAAPVMQFAWSLLEGRLQPRDRTLLLCVTNAAVRMADRQTAESHFSWLFAHGRGIQDTYTTSSHFSV